MKRLLLLLMLCFSMTVAHAIEWEEVDVPKSSDINYITQKGDDIILCGNGVKVSNDGGETFRYSNKVKGLNFEGVEVTQNTVNNITAYITKKGNFITVPRIGYVLYSHNKGDFWEPSNLSFDFKNARLFEDNNVICLVHKKGIHYSTDEGKTWIDLLTTDIYSEYIKCHNINNKIYYYTSKYSQEKTLYFFDTESKKIDSVTGQHIVGDAYKYENQLYVCSYSYIDNSLTQLYKSTDEGLTWEMVKDLKTQIHNAVSSEYDSIYVSSIDVADGLLWGTYKGFNDENEEESPLYVFSTDNGDTFRKYEYDEEEFPSGLYIMICDNELYTWNSGIMKYNAAENTFEDLDYTFANTYLYRNIDGAEIAISNYSRLDLLNQWNKNDEGWEPDNIHSSGLYTVSMQGHTLEGIETENGRKLRVTYKDQLDTLFSDQYFIMQGRTMDDGSLLLLPRTKDIDRHNAILLDKENVFAIQDSVYLRYDYCKKDNSYSYLINNGNHLVLYSGFTNMEQKDSIRIETTVEKYFQIQAFSCRGDMLIFRSQDFLYTSIDGGKTLYSIDNSNAFSQKMEISVHNNRFYASGAQGFFRSTDGITWENLLEEKFEGNIGVLNYEFDPKGYIYAYTTMGTFKSKDPVSVEESKDSHTPNISINIYPNPSSDVLNYEFNGQVDNAEVIDLSGNTINCPNSLSALDISDLSSGAYFLKITSNGKTYYRQFVKAE